MTLHRRLWILLLLTACGGQANAPDAATPDPSHTSAEAVTPPGPSAAPKSEVAAATARPVDSAAPSDARAEARPDPVAAPSPRADDTPSAPSKASAAPGDSANDYFPLRAGAEYEYRGAFHGRVYDTKLVVHQADGKGEAAYYFIEPERENAPGDTFFGATNIGAGLYASRADGVYTADIPWRNQLGRASPALMRRMIATPIQVGAVTQLDGHWAHHYTIEGFERVKVPAGSFERAVRVGIKAGEAGASTESSTAWLAPGVGVVRWLRATGRMDELISFRLPPKG